MKAHDMNGQEFDITKAEAERIAGEVAKLNLEAEAERLALDGHETNEVFLNRALNNVKSVSGVWPKTEDELKEVLYQNIPNTSMKTIELLYEAMEVITAWHKKKVG